MKLQVLIATMDRSDYSLLNKMNINSDAIVINQCDVDSSTRIEFKGNGILWINSTQRGLSRSRNMALKNASADICVLADDDLEYTAEYELIIMNEFVKNPSADIIAFQIEGIEKKFKEYYPKARKLNYVTSMKISSVEIAFRLSSIRKEKIYFNELFGSGATYKMGEENIFIFECLKKGLTVIYVPIKIADLHIRNSSWFKGFTRDYFEDLGAAYTAMSKRFSLLFVIQYGIRKRKLYNRDLSLLSAIKYMLKGRKKYLMKYLN